MWTGLFLRNCFIFLSLCGSFSYVSCWQALRYQVGSQRAKSSLKKHRIFTNYSPLLSTISPSLIEFRTRDSLPRFHEDIADLVNWIVAHGGEFNAKVVQDTDGWSLVSKEPLKKHSTIVRIPKTLCISSQPSSFQSLSTNSIGGSKLSPNAIAMMNTLSENQWRARLGIALLSEYTRIDSSFYSPYIRNIPFEIRGLPIFCKFEELQLVQDQKVVEETLGLCDFLQDFSDNALKPLFRSGFDPFSGREVTLNSFGWSFGIASSRALRPQAIISTDTTSMTSSPVLIPGVDLAQHSFMPTCQLYDTGTHYLLLANEEIPSPNTPLTISYGSLSNNELLLDYGFTVDDNPYDAIVADVNETLVNAARSVMGQCNITDAVDCGPSFPVRHYMGDISSLIVDESGSAGDTVVFHPELFSAREIGISHRHDIWHEKSLTMWQQFWLYTLEMYSNHKKEQMTFGADSNKKLLLPSMSQLVDKTKVKLSSTVPFSPWYHDSNGNHVKDNSKSSPISQSSNSFQTVAGDEIPVDPRLWALLRILYSEDEKSLLQHGYDPWLLQHPGSMLSLPEEAHIVRTMMGMLTIILKGFQTNIKTDLQLLLGNNQSKSRAWKGVPTLALSSIMNSAEYKEECRKILKSFFETRDLILFNSTIAHEEVGTDPSSTYLPLYMQNRLNLDEQGKQLSHNLQEIYKFRIRKKMVLIKILWQLCDLYQTIYFTAKHEYFRSHRLNESMVFPPLRLSLHSSPQSEPAPTINQRQNSTALEKIARNKRRRPQWTPQDDEEILQQLHLSHILSSPFLSKNSFPAPLSFPNEVESSCQGADETEATNCQRTTEKIPKQRAYEGASKSVSTAEKNARTAAAMLQRAAKVSEKYRNSRIRL